ncbi:hypothetical protein ACFL4D_02965 [Candidatus Margulisiibacteriota bacterium]
MKLLPRIVIAVLLVCVLGFSSFGYSDLSISGLAYIQYSSDENGNDAFNATRIYLDIQRKLGDNILRYTTDIDPSGRYDVYSKYLYVQLNKICPFGSIVRIGQIPTPWVGFVDGIHGFRYVQNSMTDEFSLLGSTDRGISATKELGRGLSLDLAILNGTGFTAVENDGRKDLAVKVTYKAGNLTLAAHSQLSGSAVSSANTDSKLSIINGLAAYKFDNIQVAGEIATGTKDGLKISCLSIFANAKIAEDMKVFARFDTVDNDTDTADSSVAGAACNTKLLVIGGIEKVIAQKVKASLNIQNTKDGKRDAVNTFYMNMQVDI